MHTIDDLLGYSIFGSNVQMIVILLLLFIFVEEVARRALRMSGLKPSSSSLISFLLSLSITANFLYTQISPNSSGTNILNYATLYLLLLPFVLIVLEELDLFSEKINWGISAILSALFVSSINLSFLQEMFKSKVFLLSLAIFTFFILIRREEWGFVGFSYLLFGFVIPRYYFIFSFILYMLVVFTFFVVPSMREL